MIWLLSFALGTVIGLNSSALLVVIAAALLGVAIVLNAILSGMGLLDIPREVVLSALAFNFGLVVGLAAALIFRRR